MRKTVIASTKKSSVFIEGNNVGVLRKKLYIYLKSSKKVDGKTWLEDNNIEIEAERAPQDKTWIVGVNFNISAVTLEIKETLNGFAKSLGQKAQWDK